MRFPSVAFIIYQIILASQAEKFQLHFQRSSQKIDKTATLKASESRYHGYQERDFRSYNNRKDFYLPIAFKDSNNEPRHYWRNEQGYDNRRTFFHDYSFKTTAFPGFYPLMSSIFTGRDEATSEQAKRYYPRNHPIPPYLYSSPLHFLATEPNYVPPPKPIRASVIKLETISRSPIYPSDYETTPKYYPPPKSLLNHVLIENSKAGIPPFRPLPVLPKPIDIPTTIKPNYSLIKNRNLLKHFNDTNYRHPESVQDQLPYFDPEEVKIPYVSEKPIPQIFNTLSPQNHSEFFLPTNSRTTTKIIDLLDIRSFSSGENRQERPEHDITTTKSFPGAVQKVKLPTFKYAKKVAVQPDKGSVERVANLTVQGLSKKEKENFNPHHINDFDVRNLINYEMRKLVSVSNLKQSNDSAKRQVNLNDELSLDAKILKDTNWDGLTLLSTSTTKETTMAQTTQPTAFWEIGGQTTTEVTTTTEQTKIRTTESPSTIEITETTPATTTTTTTITTTAGKRMSYQEELNRISENVTQQITENSKIIMGLSRKMNSARRYSRRPKVVNFTPYPTSEDVQYKLVNRINFPKRQKPNITITFGNKNVLKNPNNFGKDEVMKFSDEEDMRKRKKIGKRRHLFKRVRVTTSERPL